MELEWLVTKANFAKLAGVNKSTITSNCRPGRKLADIVKNNRVNALHEIAVIYLSEKGKQDVVENFRKAAMMQIPGIGCDRPDEALARHKKKEDIKGAPITPIDESSLPEDVREYGNMTLMEIIQKFGTDIRFAEWLRSSTQMESLYEKRLKNKLVEKSLIPRQFVAKHLFNAVEQINVRMLTDAPRTIASRVMALAEAGEPVEVIEETVRQIISTQIKGLKKKMERGIDKA